MPLPTPRVWKMLLLTWICIYPLLNIILFVASPFIGGWHPLLRTLVLSVVLVPSMSVVLRAGQVRFAGWLVQ